MALTKDFWEAWSTWSLADEYLTELTTIAITFPRYSKKYAYAKYAEAKAKSELNEIIEDLMIYNKYTDDMEAILVPANLAAVYPDKDMIADFWSIASPEDRLTLMLRLGIQYSLASQFTDTPYTILPRGFKDKMEAIHG